MIPERGWKVSPTPPIQRLLDKHAYTDFITILVRNVNLILRTPSIEEDMWWRASS